jgi:hypothetical protein
MAKKKSKIVGHIDRRAGHMYYADRHGNVHEVAMKTNKGKKGKR